MIEQLKLLSQEWGLYLVLGAQLLLIVLLAWLLQRLLARGLMRLALRYQLPPELVLPLRGGIRWFIMGSAGIMVLERVGVSATVLWTAISGFAAVAAVAFFAIWSVLSNLLCSVLILTMGSFRIGDVVEILESLDKPVVKGRVVAINMLYSTLEEAAEGGTGAMVQVPNNMFFQKVVRRWRGTDSFSFSINRE
jgi:small-conductance mechanosensitive channel